MSVMLPIAVLLSVLLGFLVPLFYRVVGKRLGHYLAVFPLALFTYFLTLLPQIARGNVLASSFTWMRIPFAWLKNAAGNDAILHIDFGFRLDGLAMLFALLITGIGTLVFVYAGSYLGKDEDHAAFFSYLMLFMGAMLGVVMADNLVLLYLFWEMTSITSFLLIGFWSHRDESRYGALKALLVTAAGGLAMLAGSVLILVVTDSVNLADILASSGALQASPLYPVIMILILLGAFTKAAQVPFHLWLPNAMEAPTPVSAYLHSAAMVKAGIYLIARMTGILGGTSLWLFVVAGVGITSLVLASYLALRQTDLKAILAFSTISQLGLITALFGWNTPLAVTAGLFHTLNHSVFKASLFMMVGIVDHQTGTRDIRHLKGLAAFMPITAGIALVSSLALAGIPPLNGFVSKEMFFGASLGLSEALAAYPVWGPILQYAFPVLAVLGSTLTFVYSLMIAHGVFRKGEAPPELAAKAADPGRGLWLPPAILAGLAVIFGIFPGLADKYVVAPATTAVWGQPAHTPLALWHGFNVPLLMSIIVIVVGFLLYVRVDALRRFLVRIPSRINVNRIYDWSLDALVKVSEFVEGRLLTGFSRDYFAYMLGFFLLLLGLTASRFGMFPIQTDWPLAGSIQWTQLLFAVLAIGATCSVPFFRTRVASVVALGVVGTSLIMLWTLFQAPDLSLTMLVVETVSLLLFLLVFAYLPRLKKEVSSTGARWINIIISAASGVAVTLLMLGSRGLRGASPIAEYYLENSLTTAHGRNVVNVVLVDFRGFDTLFEITVLALAGVGVYMLSNMRSKGGSK